MTEVNNKKKFTDFKLPEMLLKSFEEHKFINPTPIQEEVIPLAMNGQDILGSAQTGTGKSLAFITPMISKLLDDKIHSGIILVPTRELAKQVLEVVRDILTPNMKINTALLIGGDKIAGQKNQLKNKPRIIVGTPGRINDFLEKKFLKLHQTDYLVLDEMDRMLDMGFGVQIETIINRMPQERQTLMLSATMPKNIMKMANKYLMAPVVVEIEGTKEQNENIEQDFIHLKEDEKFDKLIDELDNRSGSVVIFAKTKRGVERLVKRINELKNDSHSVNYIHGDLRQRHREQVVKKYRDYKFRILVATDVAARGLDIPHIEHVINYDLPQQAEDYTHRIGRTGRNGAKGYALTLVSPAEKKEWKELSLFLDPSKEDEFIEESKKNRKSRSRNRRSGGGKGH
ncbi:MAG: DEAD/DEAH box helicase [Alphaproteobacteria bacterium]|jgi:superfamily II DNA/RNA helicase|nr:DEAD/DEAH box helicase [Alphaproteobacteria bacterium]